MNREQGWLVEARAEMAAASDLFQGGHWSWCCFTAQQAAWRQMFEDRNILLLDALEHGQVIFDRGAFDAMRRTFQRWLASGEVARSGPGWRI